MRNNYEIRPPRVDPMPLPYNQILPNLIHKGWVTHEALALRIPPYPLIFDENAKYGYHDGSPGHIVDNCKALQYKVQELIDVKLLTFKELGQNVKNNQLLGHPGLFVNSIEYVNKELANLVCHCLPDTILNSWKAVEISYIISFLK